jgi:hypothetical protein
MPELLELLETFRAEQASVERLFGGEGLRARRGQGGAVYLNRLAEATKFLSDVLTGKRPAHQLREAMTTSDFPNLFGDVLDRQLLANYREYPTSYPAFVNVGTVSDFRTKKLFTLDGAEGVLQEVAEKTEYPAGVVDDSGYSYSVKKFGRRLHFSWETMINDDLEAFRRSPERLARAARRSEQRFVTTLYVDANGPHASFYTIGNANIVTGNPALSISALQTAMTQLAARVDTDSEPIFIESVVLVVPPALEITARNILNAVQLELVEVGGTSNQKLIAQNWMRDRLTLVVDPYIPVIASSSNGNTSWFLFTSPSGDRPALEIGFLRGHEEPEIFMKMPNQTRIGGGGAPVMEDFDTDGIQYKVRHVFGGSTIDPKMTMGSQGDGS